jgi:glucosamine--fructose-6-phosphate aminotransferase (isomerizing)
MHTRAEILSQPECWATCIRMLEGDEALRHAVTRLQKAPKCLFIGCGSSYYLAMTAAAVWRVTTGGEAATVPASEVLLHPELAVPGTPATPVIISRSGRTSEAVRVAEYFQQERGTETLAITCAGKSPLGTAAQCTISLPAADEKSTVMTRSFSSMLLGIQVLAARVGGRSDLLRAMGELPALVQAQLGGLDETLGEIGSQRFGDYVFLGQGPFFGLASESMLKVKEMSCSYAQAYHTLEFRHGPKSILSPEVLVTFLLSAPAYETDVVEEVKSLGARTLVICNAAEARIRAAADNVIELGLDLPEDAQLPAWIVPGQLLGWHTSSAKGLDCDNPPHLSRVVMLDEKQGQPVRR